MAITIIKEPQGALLNAYNNSIIEFGTDVSTPARATILIDAYTFEITPNQGVFYFNLKEIIKVLINQGNFKDDIEVLNPANFLFPDASLFLEIDYTITVFKTNGTSETLDKTYKYIKSAKQIVRSYFDENDLIKFLTPSKDLKAYITYFEGYPFDVSIYSNIARTVTITHKRTATTLDISLSKGVNRLFLSNGENDNLGFEEQLPLYIGLNELEFEVDASNKLTLFVTKMAVDCGVYLKWFNENGAWSFWKFSPIYKESINTKSLDEINSDFNNIEDSVSRVTQTGKEATKTLALQSGRMNERERLVVSQIFSSPKVFYYNQLELQPFQKVDWKEIKTPSTNQELNNTKKTLTEYDIKIELPEQYTQTYAG